MVTPPGCPAGRMLISCFFTTDASSSVSIGLQLAEAEEVRGDQPQITLQLIGSAPNGHHIKLWSIVSPEHPHQISFEGMVLLVKGLSRSVQYQFHDLEVVQIARRCPGVVVDFTPHGTNAG